MGVSIKSVAMELPENVLDYFRKQGKIGAKKRAATLSPERRKEIATLAAQTRWAKVKETSKKPSAKKRSSSKESQ
jgi:hypothetical protein